MKKYLSSLLALAALVAVAFTLRAPRNTGDYDLVSFARLPTLVNGRLKPLDTIARTSLLLMQGRQRVVAPDGGRLPPAEWLLDMLYRPAKADVYQVFEIVHPDVLALLALSTNNGAGGKRFSLHQLAPHLSEVDRQAKRADSAEAAERTPFQRAIVQLRDAVALYQRLQGSLVAPGSTDFLDRLAQFETTLPSVATAVQTHRTGPSHDSPAAKLLLELGSSFAVMDNLGYLRPIPPSAATFDNSGWKTAGAAWTESFGAGRVAPAALTYAALGRAWIAGQPAAFNQAVQSYQRELEVALPAVMTKGAVEARFNSAQPFYTSALLYVAAFLLAMVSWLKWPEVLGRAAFALVLVAFLVASAGIITRMWLEARPPVTNLYSSALFVGWAAVALCLVLEYFFRAHHF